jgi:hypothetical protein
VVIWGEWWKEKNEIRMSKRVYSWGVTYDGGKYQHVSVNGFVFFNNNPDVI